MPRHIIMNTHPKTPVSKAYFMPAEWEPHEATWITWPHNEANWPGKFEPIPDIFAQMVEALSRGEKVHLLIQNDAIEAQARETLARRRTVHQNVFFHRIPTNLGWTRDCGCIFLVNEDPMQRLLALDWEFNAWGGKYPPYDLDNAVARRMAEILGLAVVSPGMVLEGGSIEVNGAGMLLTTESVLLNPNRNPGLSREQIEERLKANLGVRQIVWLGDGIAGDDTDGHVDDLTRFVSEDTVVTVVEPDPADENHAPLRDNLERLRGVKTPVGIPLNIIELPMPDPVVYEGQRLPASYANFYIGNSAVLVPVYDCPEKDARAIDILTRCFPDRVIAAIPSADLIWGLGSFHCLTQQQPLAAR